MSEPQQQRDVAASAGEIVALGEKTHVSFVYDEDHTIRHYMSLLMQGAGIDNEEFPDLGSLREALAARLPDIIFLDVQLDTTEILEMVTMLQQRGYRGGVQLMSTRGTAVMESIKATGEQAKLQMLPVMKKPFDTTTIQKVIAELKIGRPAPLAARIGLVDALAKNWIEFWYQPKIDLRRKRLVGAESFARARHPEFGVLTPNAFMPGAHDDNLLALAERAMIDAMRMSENLAKIDVHIRITVNMPIGILARMKFGDVIKHERIANGPGLMVDIDEKSVINDIPLTIDLAKKLAPHNIKLAIDDFGRGYNALSRSQNIPFAEMKLDRSFVTDCGVDKLKGPVCKNVIDLAHKLGASAVGVGVEKAADLIALAGMGCDYGQGHLLGQPMAEARFLSLLRQRASSRPRAESPQTQVA